MRRQRFVLLAVVALFGAACSDGQDSSATSASVETSTSVETSAVESASTAGAPTTVAATPETPAAPLVPEVCWGSHGAYFGFDNQSSVPVVVPEGPGNRLEGGVAGDNPLLTTLFAPGRTEFAFWVVPGSADAAAPVSIVWTLAGPDGVERSAMADELTEACAASIGEPNAADPRLPDLEVSDEAVTAAGDAVTLTVTVVGVPDLSVCNSAFTAEPVGISLDEATLPTGIERVRSFTLPLEPSTQGSSRLASVEVVTNVVDYCSFEGLTVSSWPVTQQFRLMGLGFTVCAWVDDSDELSVQVTPGLCELGGTGGTRTRPG